MNAHVVTRWTSDGLVEMVMDASTAQTVLHALRLDQVPVIETVRVSLAHTLAHPKD